MIMGYMGYTIVGEDVGNGFSKVAVYKGGDAVFQQPNNNHVYAIEGEGCLCAVMQRAVDWIADGGRHNG